MTIVEAVVLELQGTIRVPIDVLPTECPRCERALVPKMITAVAEYDTTTKHVAWTEVIYQCANKECKRPFIARYEPYITKKENQYLQYIWPEPEDEPEVDKRILELSERYIEVFRQASLAEQRGLDELAGMGYRKALEILIKDYCIDKKPDEQEKIEGLRLMACMKEYLKGPILENAKRAAWLGNDETHYLRVWEDHDIEDLKLLIDVVREIIKTELITKEYQEKMPDKSKETPGGRQEPKNE